MSSGSRNVSTRSSRTASSGPRALPTIGCLVAGRWRSKNGNSLLVREPLRVDDPERLDLGNGRSAVRAVITLADGTRVLAATTQLHHIAADRDVRERQTAHLVDWLRDPPSVAAIVLMGSFNASPSEPANCSRRLDTGPPMPRRTATSRR